MPAAFSGYERRLLEFFMKMLSQLSRKYFVALLGLGVAACVSTGFAQVRPTHRPDVPNFDNRVAPQPTAEAVASQQKGLGALKSKLPSTVVDFDTLLATPKF